MPNRRRFLKQVRTAAGFISLTRRETRGFVVRFETLVTQASQGVQGSQQMVERLNRHSPRVSLRADVSSRLTTAFPAWSKMWHQA